MDNNALVPDGLELNAEPIEKTEIPAIAEAEQSDRELASLMGSKGWEHIAKEMRVEIDKLRNMTGVEIANKDFAEVGQKFLVSSLTADKLQMFLDKVENATKAVIDAERAKQPK